MPNSRKSSKTPDWLPDAQDHAMEYLVRFVNNPGIERIVNEFDTHYARIKNPSERVDYLAKIAKKEWDFRKGRERFEITETFAMDDPDSKLGQIVHEGADFVQMSSHSRATLDHYSAVVVLGGANMAPYYRLKYALEQTITYDTLAYLGSERELQPPELETIKRYAPGAHTEFDLGKGAITALMGDQLAGSGEYEVVTSEWRIAHLQKKDGTPILLLSSPPFLGVKRANTADTYDFLRRLEQEAFRPPENILFTTGATYRYAQYFDAVREISLRTGVDVEIIGFDPAYSKMEFKASQLLQELKAAADAAVRLRDALNGKEDRNEWRKNYYNRFTRDESLRPHKD
jgi:hypothetical protein